MTASYFYTLKKAFALITLLRVVVQVAKKRLFFHLSGTNVVRDWTLSFLLGENNNIPNNMKTIAFFWTILLWTATDAYVQSKWSPKTEIESVCVCVFFSRSFSDRSFPDSLSLSRVISLYADHDMLCYITVHIKKQNRNQMCNL
jgi:hypothetical protein